MVDIVGNETLASLWDKLARECGDKDFFIFQDREGNVATYSYRAFNELIDQTANMFLSQGVERGEHVAVQMHTCPEFLMCLFGLAKIGAVLVPMNEQYLQAECEYALDMCSTRRAVVEPCYVDATTTPSTPAAGLTRASSWPAAKAARRPWATRCSPSW